MPGISETEGGKVTTAERGRFRGLENVTAAARELAQRLRDTTVDFGEMAEQELAFVVGLTEGIRDKSVTPELLKQARELPVLKGLRVTSHRVVDLGFDVVGVGVKLGSDAFDDILAPRVQRLDRVTASAG